MPQGGGLRSGNMPRALGGDGMSETTRGALQTAKKGEGSGRGTSEGAGNVFRPRPLQTQRACFQLRASHGQS